SGTGWWSSGTEAYDEEILARVGLDPALLPRVVRPGEVAGTVRDGHGLPFSKGTLVACGTGDNAAAALGLVARPGVPVVSRGSSDRHGGRVRRRARRLAAAGLHPELHARRGPGGRAAPPRPRGRGARPRRHAPAVPGR